MTTRVRSSIYFSPEYYFVDRPEFEKMIAEKKFLEHAEFAGNRYGTRWGHYENMPMQYTENFSDAKIEK